MKSTDYEIDIASEPWVKNIFYVIKHKGVVIKNVENDGEPLYFQTLKEAEDEIEGYKRIVKWN